MLTEVVSATKLDEGHFWSEAPLAAHLRRSRFDRRLRRAIAFENSTGLPEIYNRAINGTSDLLAFVHDDVWIEDLYFVDRLGLALSNFDVVGVVGSARRLPHQSIWCYSPSDKRMDKAFLRGAVGHGPTPFAEVDFYGSTPAPCEILDGLFIGARRNALVKSGVTFDARFDFHFYDLDFCRTAVKAGLRVGVWPIGMTHRRTGIAGAEYDTGPWADGRARYFDKWGD